MSTTTMSTTTARTVAIEDSAVMSGDRRGRLTPCQTADRLVRIVEEAALVQFRHEAGVVEFLRRVPPVPTEKSVRGGS